MNSVGRVSKRDWLNAPEGATHSFKYNVNVGGSQDGYYKIEDGKIYYWSVLRSRWDITSHSQLEIYVYCVSKEEDLEMDKKEVKQVRGVDDLELGMFLKSETGNIVVVTRDAGKVNNLKFFSCSNMANAQVAQNGAGKEFYDRFLSWSYTYSGEYTPIIKETEAERKIKELEATIKLAQKQLQEYKEMK